MEKECCKKKWEESKDKTKMDDAKNKQKPMTKFRAGIHCYSCGKEGHYARDCRSKKKEGTNATKLNKQDKAASKSNKEEKDKGNKDSTQQGKERPMPPWQPQCRRFNGLLLQLLSIATTRETQKMMSNNLPTCWESLAS